MSKGGGRPRHLKLVKDDRPNRQDEIEGAKVLGTLVLIGSLAMLFFASLIGYLLVRARAPQWPPAGMPGMPLGLWLSTAILIGTSLAIHRAVKSAREDQLDGVKRWATITFALGSLFLIAQALNWAELAAQSLTPRVNLYGFTFYLLTGLHFFHVVGGLIALGLVVRNARRGRYTSQAHDGLMQCALYWHFLDAVWVIVFLALLAGS